MLRTVVFELTCLAVECLYLVLVISTVTSCIASIRLYKLSVLLPHKVSEHSKYLNWCPETSDYCELLLELLCEPGFLHMMFKLFFKFCLLIYQILQGSPWVKAQGCLISGNGRHIYISKQSWNSNVYFFKCNTDDTMWWHLLNFEFRCLATLIAAICMAYVLRNEFNAFMRGGLFVGYRV